MAQSYTLVVRFDTDNDSAAIALGDAMNRLLPWMVDNVEVEVTAEDDS